jgi:cytidylate kinase
MIVTIDGPAAAGKSSAARALAERLGFDFLDTGAMYRAVALAALRSHAPLDSEPALAKLADSIHITVRGGLIFLDGEDVTDAIRGVEVTRASRHVADSPAVRERMVTLQRAAAQGGNVVTEGRDQGTVVFPSAACKVFLTAAPEVRAARRQRQWARRGQVIPLEEVLADQAERDGRDASRAIAPMVPAPDAIVLDSTSLSLEQVVDELEGCVRRAFQK